MKKILFGIILCVNVLSAWQLTYNCTGSTSTIFNDFMYLKPESMFFTAGINWPGGYPFYTTYALVHASSDGDTIWTRMYSPGLVVSNPIIRPLETGEYLLFGSISPDLWGENKPDYFCQRFSATFDPLWLVRYGSTLHDRLADVVAVGDDRFFLFGNSFFDDGDSFLYKGYLACVSSDGDTIWERFFGNNVISTTDAFISRDSLSIYCLFWDFNDDTFALKITQFSLDGDSIGHAGISSYYPSPIVFNNWATGIDREDGWMVVGNLNYCSFIAKYNRDDDSVSFEEVVSLYAYINIEQLDDSVFVVSGNCGARPNRDIALIWLDYHGDTIRSTVFDIQGDQIARSLSALPNKNIVLYGPSKPLIGSYQALAIMVDSLGNDIPGAAIEETPALPATFEISAWPNPFNSAVKISLDGTAICHPSESGNPEGVAVEIYDLNGRRITQLSDGGTVGAALVASRDAAKQDFSEIEKREGTSPSHTTRVFTWRPDETVTSGVYLVRARVGDESTTKRIVYLK